MIARLRGIVRNLLTANVKRVLLTWAPLELGIGYDLNRVH